MPKNARPERIQVPLTVWRVTSGPDARERGRRGVLATGARRGQTSPGVTPAGHGCIHRQGHRAKGRVLRKGAARRRSHRDVSQPAAERKRGDLLRGRRCSQVIGYFAIIRQTVVCKALAPSAPGGSKVYHNGLSSTRLCSWLSRRCAWAEVCRCA
jgi:hypothetical protein